MPSVKTRASSRRSFFSPIFNATGEVVRDAENATSLRCTFAFRESRTSAGLAKEYPPAFTITAATSALAVISWPAENSILAFISLTSAASAFTDVSFKWTTPETSGKEPSSLPFIFIESEVSMPLA
jgi:hypothetical protein